VKKIKQWHFLHELIGSIVGRSRGINSARIYFELKKMTTAESKIVIYTPSTVEKPSLCGKRRGMLNTENTKALKTATT
jgi:hypothetical protein